MSQRPIARVLMLLENSSFPEDSRVLLQARSLTEVGYRVTVIAPTEPGAQRLWENLEGIRVYRYPAAPDWGGVIGYGIEYGYSIVVQFCIAVWVGLRHGFDTIHMHTPPDMNAVTPAIFRWFGKKFVYDLHDLSPELYLAQKPGRKAGCLYRLLLWFERFASRTADLSISTNESQRDRQVERCDVPAEKFHVVRNGPNQAFLRDDIVPRRVVAETNVLILGYVGVMGSQDGVDYLIRALDCLVHRLGRTQVRLVLVGSGSSVPELRHLVTDLNLDRYVTFTGKVPFAEVPAYIAGFDICCTPDPRNAYNDSCTTIKTMEYMALGKPVVCFETTENMKTAREAALYAKDNDIEEYAEKLNQLVGDPTTRVKLGELGRRRILNELSWLHQAQRLITAYDRLHHRPPGP